jgi:hypothetical protein
VFLTQPAIHLAYSNSITVKEAFHSGLLKKYAGELEMKLNYKE